MPRHNANDFESSKLKMLRLTLLTNPDMCNLHCPLCFLQQRGQKFGMGEMPFDVARRAIESALPKGLREVIPSTMGEPLLYSRFDELLELCRAHGVPVNLTTNGSFPGTWGSDVGMARLLAACSDIKVSCMGWDESFAEMMPGLTFDKWKKNVEQLVECKRRMAGRGNEESCEAECLKAGSNEAIRSKAESARVATISLQVTLHRKNFEAATEILQWAESIGISRIKWNLPVFLSVVPGELRERYGLADSEVDELRKKVKSDVVSCEGSLFFGSRLQNAERKLNAGSVNLEGVTPCAADCPFTDELWVLPDGSEQRCPNPERRFGNPGAALARCENCPMRG